METNRIPEHRQDSQSDSKNIITTMMKETWVSIVQNLVNICAINIKCRLKSSSIPHKLTENVNSKWKL